MPTVALASMSTVAPLSFSAPLASTVMPAVLLIVISPVPSSVIVDPALTSNSAPRRPRAVGG